MKLKVLTRFGEMGASSRMRAFQYLPYLKAAGIDVEIVPLFLNQDLQARYRHGSYGVGRLARRYFRRVSAVLKNNSDLLWIEKELMPWAPAWFEKLLIGRRKYVMGTAGRQIVEQNYCIQKTGPQVVSYLKRSFGVPNAPTAIDVDQPVPAEAPAGDPLVSK